MTDTPLDRAHAAMDGAPQNDALRLAFYERVADAEMHLLLEREADGDRVDPRIFDTGEGRFVLAFDREERLTAFTGGPAPYAALSGRSLVALLQGSDLGLGINLSVAPSETLLPPDALAWLSETLDTAPTEAEEIPESLAPPSGLPESLIGALDTKLAAAAGLAEMAYLAAATWKSGRRGHMLAMIDALPGAEPALARGVSEALIFSGLDAGELDVTFLRRTDPVAARLAKVGLRFDLPKPPEAQTPGAPGMDPEKPPKLR